MKHIMHSRYKQYNKVFGSIAMFIFNNNVISFTELIWSQVKGFVARKNVRSRPLKDMKELDLETFAAVSIHEVFSNF